MTALYDRNMELTPSAMEAISDFYADLRQNNEHLRLPITVRTLESIIRLSTAAAKARMSEEGVEEVSCLGVASMVLFMPHFTVKPSWVHANGC